MVFNSTEVDIIYREPTPLPSSDAPSPRTETSGGSFTAPYRRC